MFEAEPRTESVPLWPNFEGLINAYLDEASTCPDTDSPESAALSHAAAVKLMTSCHGHDIEGFCWSLWSSVVDAVKQASRSDGPAHPDDPLTLSGRVVRLAELVRAIKDLGPLTLDNGEIASCWGGQCWNDLPILGAEMREAWNCERGLSTESSARAEY